jgi:DNA polymerase I-like protein with 3'-5' exonuclease and polymerase domains
MDGGVEFADVSPLAGSYMVAFIHDEILIEAPKERAAEAAARLSELMVQGMKMFVRDIPVLAEPVIMDRWYKDAKPTFDDSGKLVAWEP